MARASDREIELFMLLSHVFPGFISRPDDADVDFIAERMKEYKALAVARHNDTK